MGSYVNPDSISFQESIRGQIYVDKTGLIARTNAVIGTPQKNLCISRPRRFGKSMGLGMLAAYYAYGQDSRALFEGFEIADDASFEEHLNAYDVVQLNMQNLLSFSGHDVGRLIERIGSYVGTELIASYPDASYLDAGDLSQVMLDVFAHTGRPFVILIDEWDCLFREFKEDKDSQKVYLDFLRAWIKDQPYVGLAYMTGILPVKKYGTHSALNMFTEYSMTQPRDLAPYFGFTQDEVRVLCDEYDMDFDEVRGWYDGYGLTYRDRNTRRQVNLSIYSPRSVVEAMLSGYCGSYWVQTETYEALKVYIEMNMDGLKDDIASMIAGKNVPADMATFENDMTTFHRKDDVLALLVHLGYLSFEPPAPGSESPARGLVCIPNREVAGEYAATVSVSETYNDVARSIEASRKLLEALLAGDEQAVAAGLERAHFEISILSYNDEESLACAISLAFYYAREYYLIVREMPTGKGFADVCWIPKKHHADKPACIVELKVDSSVGGAIGQIHDRNYPDALREWAGEGGELILCGINYNRSTKTHDCRIERLQV